MRSTILFFLVLNASVLWAQNSFSYRFHFGFPAAELTSIVATDSCYYVTGIIADSIPPFNTGNIFVKFSLDGQVLIAKTLKDTLKTYETWRGNLAVISPGKLAVSGYAKDSTRKALLLVFNTQGDTLLSAEYPHPDYPAVTGTINHDFKKTVDGYVLLNWIKNPDGTGDTDIELLKLDTAGQKLWSRTFGITSRNDAPHNVITTPGGYIIVSIRDNTNVAHQNIEAHNHIFKINEAGEVLWEYFSPSGELRGKEGRAIATSDGGLLVMTGQGIEVPAGTDASQLRWHNYAFKLDSSRHEEWGVLVRDSFQAISYNNQLTSGIEVQDGSGYAVAGNLIEGTPEDGLYFDGVLAKISSDGVLLWKRYYQHIPSQNTRHYINDLAQAPDGGFIMVGEVRDTINAPRQQGWLLKVDEYGCLVPGCELVSGVRSSDDSKSSDDFTLLLYPNPVSEELQVYFSGPAGGEHHFRILDAQGREWRRFSTRLPASPDVAGHAGRSSEVTLLVEVDELPAGVYYLQYLREGKVVAMEGFVKR